MLKRRSQFLSQNQSPTLKRKSKPSKKIAMQIQLKVREMMEEGRRHTPPKKLPRIDLGKIRK